MYCLCVNVYCHRVTTQLQLTNISKSSRMRWEGHVASTGMGEVYTRFWWGNLRERDHLEDPGVDRRIILR